MNSRRSIVIVANPQSGRGRDPRLPETIADRLRQAGRIVSIAYTEKRGDGELASMAAMQKEPVPECIVACGGDGTIQEVAHALAISRDQLGQRTPILGLAPCGRCNDFARVLGIGPSVDRIVDVILHGTSHSIDLGRVNDRFFCTVATIGVDADISRYVDRMRVPLRGTLAYLYGTLCVMSRYRGRQLRIEGDFGVIDQPIFVASTANTSSYGGAIQIAPHAMPFDGYLDLCIIDQISRFRSAVMLPRILAGRHTLSHGVRFLRTRKLNIESQQPVEIWADGEPVARTPVTIEAMPAAIRVALPTGWAPPGSNGTPGMMA